MLVIVVIMFGVCWLPLHTFFLVLDFNPGLTMNASKADKQLFTMIYCAAFWLAMFNSCANPIVYGFTNDSFRHDLASLCYLGFPFCVCLKHVANRRLSVSTFDSVNCKRFCTNRKSQGTSASRQGGIRNGCRVYLELKKDSFRERRSANMNEFFNQNSEADDTPNDSLNGNKVYQNHNGGNHSEHLHHHKNHHHPPCFKTESEDSTVALTSPTINGFGKSPSLPSGSTKTSSPTSAGPFGIFRTRSEDRSCSIQTTTYHQVADTEEL